MLTKELVHDVSSIAGPKWTLSRFVVRAASSIAGINRPLTLFSSLDMDNWEYKSTALVKAP